MDYKDIEIDFLRKKIALQDRLIKDFEHHVNAVNSVIDRAVRLPQKYEQWAKELEKKSDINDSALRINR